MEKKCKEITIESAYGWGAHPQYSDKLIIYKDQISYHFQVEVMGKLKEFGLTKLLFDNSEDIEKELKLVDLFKYVEKTKFVVNKDIIILDGGTISMTLTYEDDSIEKIEAPGEDLKEASKELGEFIEMLAIILRGSSIKPEYLGSEIISCECDSDDDFEESKD